MRGPEPVSPAETTPTPSRLDWLRIPNLGEVIKYGGALTAAALFATSGVGKAQASKEKATSDIVGPQIQLVCAYPKDVPSCDVERVRRAGEGMYAYTSNPQHGEPGLSPRLAMKDGRISVISTQLDATTSEVVSRALISESDPNADGNFQDYLQDQVHNKVGDEPSVDYATFIYGTPNLGKNGEACGPARIWNGMNVKHPKTNVNRNVMAIYLTNKCDVGDINGNSYRGFRAPDVLMLAALIHNEPFLSNCHEGFTGNGYSSITNDLLNLSMVWFQAKIGNYLTSAPNCPGLDINPRMDWLLRASTDGRGLIKYYKDGSEIKPDLGNRLQAGNKIEARYVPTANEKFVSWAGDCEGAFPEGTLPCEFLVDEVIDLRAKTEPNTTAPKPIPQPKKTYELKVSAEGPMRVKFLGKLRKFVDYTFKRSGSLVRLDFVLDNNNSAIKNIIGCDNEQLDKPSAKKTGVCYEVIDHKIEIIKGVAVKVPVINKRAG